MEQGLPEASHRDGERKRRKALGVSLLGWAVIRLISAVVVRGGREEEKDRHKHREGEKGLVSIMLEIKDLFCLQPSTPVWKDGTVGGMRGVWMKTNGETLLSFGHFAHLSYLMSSCL